MTLYISPGSVVIQVASLRNTSGHFVYQQLTEELMCTGGMGGGGGVGCGRNGGEKEVEGEKRRGGGKEGEEEEEGGKSRKERNSDGLLLFKGSKLLDDDYDDKVDFAGSSLSLKCSFLTLTVTVWILSMM